MDDLKSRSNSEYFVTSNVGDVQEDTNGLKKDILIAENLADIRISTHYNFSCALVLFMTVLGTAQ